MDSTETQPEATSTAPPAAATTISKQRTASPDPSSYQVYKPPTSGASTPRYVPETYFEPTKADIKLAQDSLHARTEALVNMPFRTREMREAADKSKREKYPVTRIRIKFSDRTQLEKTFPSTDKIKSVYAFVRASLREDVKPIKFVLYQTPPPRELKVSDPKVRDATLIQLQLAPNAVLHLKFLDDALNHNDFPAPLDPAVLAEAIDLPMPPNLDEQNDASSASGSGRTLGSTSGSSLSSGSKGKTTRTSGDAQKKLGKFFKGLGSKT